MIFSADSSATQSYLAMLQNIIQRMAENSRNCKLWCTTTVSAILFLAARSGEPWYVMLGLVPLLLFFLLDAYYLALERRFRRRYECVLTRLQDDSLGLKEIYVINPVGNLMIAWAVSLLSPSVCLYYPIALAAVVVVFAVQWR